MSKRYVLFIITSLILGVGLVMAAFGTAAEVVAATPSDPTQAPGAISAPAIVTPTTTAPQAEVVVAALNIRQGPGVNYTILGVAYAGDTFKVAGVNVGRSWLQISRADGSRAWISGGSAYSRVQGSLEGVPVVQAPLAPGTAPGVAPTAGAGGKLAFMNTSGGDIYLIDADGSGLRLLVNGGLDPAISPDGQQIAFTRWGPTEGVYLINADGSNERQVHAAHQPKSPAWSPDGSQLVFNLQHGGRVEQVRECKISSEDSSGDANLPPDAYDIDRRTIEEDKRYEYCYSLPPKPAWSLRQLNLATAEFKDLSSDYGSFGPAWDPRNDWRVLYSGDVSLVQLDLNQNSRVSFIEGTRDRTPAFSPDGTRLALAHRQPENDQWRIDVVNVDSGERLPLTFEGNNISPTWSPDGSQIAFLSDREGAWNIWVMNADGSNQRPMFGPGTLTDIIFEFHGVDERMLSWGP